MYTDSGILSITEELINSQHVSRQLFLHNAPKFAVTIQLSVSIGQAAKPSSYSTAAKSSSLFSDSYDKKTMHYY